MVSARKIAANRLNARKSRGPRTRAGKARASRNALRHGLAAFSRQNPALFEQTWRMAKAICGDDRDPLVFDQALLIAENQLLLQCVRTERVAVIERLRDGSAIAYAKGDNSLAVAEARFHEAQRAYPEFVRIEAIVKKMFSESGYPEHEQLSEADKSAWNPAPIEERDEHDALCEALHDLDRLIRYERRAWSRRKRAVREFMAIKARVA
jgi:hypothetical protein